MYRFRDHTHGVTWRSKRSFDRHVHKVGTVHRIHGYVYQGRYGTDAAVMITGSLGTMRLSGLSWGYGGEGPAGLRYVLERLNVSPDNIRKVLATPWTFDKVGIQWEINRQIREAA